MKNYNYDECECPIFGGFCSLGCASKCMAEAEQYPNFPTGSGCVYNEYVNEYVEEDDDDIEEEGMRAAHTRGNKIYIIGGGILDCMSLIVDDDVEVIFVDNESQIPPDLNHEPERPRKSRTKRPPRK